MMTQTSMHTWLNTGFVIAGGLTIWVSVLAGMIYA